MHVAVLGGGVVGVTTAYYLARAGHQVTVVERGSGVGLETSYANAGLVTVGHAEVWPGPGVPLKVLRMWGHEDAPVRLRLRLEPRLWAWCWRFLRNCTAEAWHANSLHSLQLARYSLEALQSLREETGLRYDMGRGLLLVTRHAPTLEGWMPVADLMRGEGVPTEVLDRTGCERVEPALRHARQRVQGGIHYPADESGDCHAFTEALAAECRRLGVAFRLGTAVTHLNAMGGHVTGVHTSHGGQAGSLAADHYVLAAGSFSAPLARQMGLRLPVYPLKGYSATVPVTDRSRVPRLSIGDLDRKLSVSRLGDRLRAAGTVEFAGYDTRLNRTRADAVLRALSAVVPQGIESRQAELWCGLRPATPDSLPIIGASPLRNLTLNTGHGTMGWTFACGSARLVADLLSGRVPDLSLQPWGLGRF